MFYSVCLVSRKKYDMYFSALLRPDALLEIVSDCLFTVNYALLFELRAKFICFAGLMPEREQSDCNFSKLNSSVR